MFESLCDCPLVPSKFGGFAVLRNRASTGKSYDSIEGIFKKRGSSEEFVKIGTWFGGEKNGRAHGTGLLALSNHEDSAIVQFNEGKRHGVTCSCTKLYGACWVFYNQKPLVGLDRCAFARFSNEFPIRNLKEWKPSFDIQKMENKPLRWLALTKLPREYLNVALVDWHLGDGWIQSRHRAKVVKTLQYVPTFRRFPLFIKSLIPHSRRINDSKLSSEERAYLLDCLYFTVFVENE